MDKRIKEYRRKEMELLKKYGFVIHSVFPGSEEDVMWSHHTHGIKESFNHMDLEIVLPVDPSLAGSILHGMVDLIKEGESFENKLTSDKVISNFDVQLVKVNDGDRDLIRIILPDENGKFPSDKDCADVYKNQLDDLNSFKS